MGENITNRTAYQASGAANEPSQQEFVNTEEEDMNELQSGSVQNSNVSRNQTRKQRPKGIQTVESAVWPSPARADESPQEDPVHKTRIPRDSTDGIIRNSSEDNMSTISRKSTATLERHETIEHIRARIGLDPEAPIVEGHQGHRGLKWSATRTILREPLAEFFGTFIMVMFGNGSVAQALLSAGDPSAPGGHGYGAYSSINWGCAIGVMLGIYVAGDSGGFLNPAITLNFCIFRKLPWRRFPIYLASQLLGGFVASGVVYANYLDAIDHVEGKGVRSVPPSKTETASIFCTYPQSFVTRTSQFFSEFICSAILMFVIFALKDDSNPGAMGKSGAGKLFPLALLFLIFGLGACFGYETGYAMNMARDLGPRLMSYMLGYGQEVWSAAGYYFWIPIIAPFLGATFGGFLYDLSIYTGPESPINTPWMGFKYLLCCGYWRTKKHQERYEV